MSDLRPNLERLGKRVSSSPDAMEQLERRRARRERTRRIATVVFALGIAVAGSFGAYAALHERPAVQAVDVGGPPPTPAIGTISCDGSTTTVETPEVAAQADGVHLRIENTSTTDLGIQFDVSGRGDNADMGTTSLLIPIAPGEERVRCFSSSDDGFDPGAPGGWETITVLDPNGFFVSPELDCPKGAFGQINDFVAGAKGDPDPAVAAALHYSKQVSAGDEVVAAGYPEDPEERTFVLRSDGVAIGSVSYHPDGQGGWLNGKIAGCQE